jgi:hypothetical protein
MPQIFGDSGAAFAPSTPKQSRVLWSLVIDLPLLALPVGCSPPTTLQRNDSD